MQNATYLIGRQPILNRNEEVVAYELLFRSAQARGSATVDDATQATASVIINALSSFGLAHILGEHRGFINLDLELLMSDSLELLPREKVVLELLETLEVTPELVERCRDLKEKGFCLALDDHAYDPLYSELYTIAEIVKVDLLLSPPDRLAEMVANFRPYPLKLLAEKVETREEFLRCRDMGFEYFQGYYFAKPSVMEKRRFDESAASLLKLMRLLNDDAETRVIEQAFRGSPGLTYKLLLLVNSVSSGMRERVRNLRHAVAILGRQQIKRWVQLALFAADDPRGTENPMVEMAAVRAAFMEELALRHPGLKGVGDAPEMAFMTGILSLLGDIYDISMQEILGQLSLSDDVKRALASRAGLYGELLELVEQVEEMNSGMTMDAFEEMGMSPEDVLAAQVAAYNWQKGMDR
jgi:EAL and modified HD-GYP domain-containing signal transduction protein